MDCECDSEAMEEFATFRDPLADPPLRVKMETTWEMVWQLTRGEIRSYHPTVVRWESGRDLQDVIWTTFAIPVIANERVVSLLQENDLTGWSTYPIVLSGKDGSVISGFRGLAITGRCGAVDWSQSQRVMKEYPAGLFPIWRGPRIRDWDGSDLFMSNDARAGYKFVTTRVRTAFQEARVLNVAFDSVERLEIDAVPSDG